MKQQSRAEETTQPKKVWNINGQDVDANNTPVDEGVSKPIVNPFERNSDSERERIVNDFKEIKGNVSGKEEKGWKTDPSVGRSVEDIKNDNNGEVTLSNDSNNSKKKNNSSSKKNK